ncbi:uncharacterized protein G2W53_021843 [Senna tora]|uniref:Uncharacterized protein n=1 Tax=Senna tora TaxID=362788 RepID=A0A834WNR0_9FABA|nr:uncharacterized protein G2W53_021843 [Senna tora]
MPFLHFHIPNTMARIHRRREIFRCGYSGGQPLGESSSTPSVSSDSKALSTDSPMACDKDSISEESLRSFIDGHLLFDLGEVTYESPAYHPEEEDFSATLGHEHELFLHYGEGIIYRDLPKRVRFVRCTLFDTFALVLAFRLFMDNAFKFSCCVASHPFEMSLLSHDGIWSLFFTYVARALRRPVLIRGFCPFYISSISFSIVARSHPFWLRESDCRPVFPLVWSTFRPTPFVEQSDLSDSNQDVVAHLTRRPRNMGSLDSKARNMVVISSNLVSSSEPLRASPGGFRGSPFVQSPSGALRVSCPSPLGEGQAPPINADAPPISDQVQEVALCKGLPLSVKLAMKLLYEALLGLHGVGVAVHSSERELVLLHTESTRLQGELIVAHQTIEEFQDTLAVKDAVMSEMVCMGFRQINLAEPSGVKKEPVSPTKLPPGFDPPTDESRESRDDRKNDGA